MAWRVSMRLMAAVSGRSRLLGVSFGACVSSPSATCGDAGFGITAGACEGSDVLVSSSPNLAMSSRFRCASSVTSSSLSVVLTETRSVFRWRYLRAASSAPSLSDMSAISPSSSTRFRLPSYVLNGCDGSCSDSMFSLRAASYSSSAFRLASWGSLPASFRCRRRFVRVRLEFRDRVSDRPCPGTTCSGELSGLWFGVVSTPLDDLTSGGELASLSLDVSSESESEEESEGMMGFAADSGTSSESGSELSSEVSSESSESSESSSISASPASSPPGAKSSSSSSLSSSSSSSSSLSSSSAGAWKRTLLEVLLARAEGSPVPAVVCLWLLRCLTMLWSTPSPSNAASSLPVSSPAISGSSSASSSRWRLRGGMRTAGRLGWRR
jgi:hypothetical protein